MDPSKKRWMIAIALGVYLLILILFIFLKTGGITGASVGLANDSQPLQAGLDAPIDKNPEPIPVELNESESPLSPSDAFNSPEDGRIKTAANCGVSTTCSCSDTVTSSYTLSANLGSCNAPLGDGLYIGANNIFIDCNGFSIIGNSSDYGIYNDGYFNVTIRNCNISGFTYGIVYSAVKNGTIVNDTISVSTDGIVLSSSSTNVTINRTTVFNSSDDGILLNTAKNITIFDSNISGSYAYDFKIIGSASTPENHTIFNNFIEGKVNLDGNTDGVLLYNNVFWNSNSTSVSCNNIDNKWNTSSSCTSANLKSGKCIGGNFYSNYTYRDYDDDSFGNIIYNVSGTGSCQDFLPLVSVYQYLAPADAATRNLALNSSFNSTNAITNASYHSARQNLTFFNATQRYLVLDAYFNATVNLAATVISGNDSAVAVNLTGTSGIAPAHILYLNHSNNKNGVTVCPNAVKLSDVSRNCSGAIALSYFNVTEGTYVSGVKATLDGSYYKIENVSGTGAILGPNASLVIWDETDSGPYASTNRSVADQVYFFANYSDSGGRNITGANCTVTYHDGTSQDMSFNSTMGLYESNRTYAAPTLGFFDWNVSCKKLYYDTLVVNDSVNISVYCGKTITTSITLAGNLGICTGDALTLGADNITINCNGTTISGNGASGKSGITGRNYDSPKITNCTITGFYYGITFYASTDNSVQNATLFSNRILNSSQVGIYLSAGNLTNLTGNEINNSANTGIYLSQTNNSWICQNRFYNNTGQALYLDTGFYNNFTNNTAWWTIGTGNAFVLISSYENTFTNNTAYQNLGYGFLLDTSSSRNLFQENVVYNSSKGFEVDNSANNNTLLRNRIFNHTSYGIFIYLSSRNNLTTNQIYGSGLSGSAGGVYLLSATPGNILYNNLIYNNTGPGLYLSSSSDYNIISWNGIYNNSNAGIYTSPGSSNSYLNISFNNLTENGRYGLALSAATYCRVLNNTIQDNAGYNIYVYNSKYNLLENNTVLNPHNRTSYGIYVYYLSDNNTLNRNFVSRMNHTGIYIDSSANLSSSENIIFNNSLYGLFVTNTNFSRFTSENITNNGQGVAFAGGSSHHLFTNGLIKNSSGLDLSLDTGSLNITLLNVSLGNASSSSNSQMVVKWYAYVTVKDAGNNNLIGVMVSAYNRTGGLEQNKTTDTNGLARIELIEFRRNSTTYSYATSHIFNASVNSYAGNATLNLTTTNSTALTLTLSYNSSGCGVVNGNILLATNIYVNGTCLTVNASNIVIHGTNIYLRGNNSGAGINLTNQVNVTIYGVYLDNFSTGLHLWNASNNTIYGNQLENNSLGLYVFNNSNYNNFSSNYFRNNTANGTVILNSSNNTIYNNYYLGNTNHSWDNGNNRWNISYSCSIGSARNIISGDCLGGNYWGGFSFSDADLDGIGDTGFNVSGGSNADNLPLVPVTAVACGNINTSTTLPLGASISTTTTCFTITANNLVLNGNGATISGDGGHTDKGVYVQGYDNITIRNLTISNFGYGIYFEGNGANYSYNCSLLNNNITATYGAGLYLNSFYNGSISNSQFSNYGEGGISEAELYAGLWLSSGESNSFNNNLFSGKYYGTIIEGSPTNNNFTNCNLRSNSGTGLVGRKNAVQKIYNYFLNSSISNLTSELNHYLYVKWYAEVNVTNSTGVSINNANVTGYDATGAIDNLRATGANGLARLELTSYYTENHVTYVLTSNHTLVARKPGYTQNSTALNLLNTNSTALNLSLSELRCGVTLTASAELEGNYTCNGDGFIIGTDNISLNGNGYYLTGNNSGKGISANGKKTFNLTNLLVSNFTSGIDLYNTNTTIIRQVTLFNNSYGLVLNQSENNLVYDSALGNCTKALIWGTNALRADHSLVNVTLDFTNASISGSTSLLRKWYVKANITLNGTTPLHGVNVTGYENSSAVSYVLTADDSRLTNASGLTALELTESRKNSSGLFYLTPTFINATYYGTYQTANNYTSVNLTQTNNTQVSLSLYLNCTVPVDDLQITNVTNLCPGTYTLADNGETGVLIIKRANVSIACDQTVLIGTDAAISQRGIYDDGYSGVNISGCELRNYYRGIEMLNSNNHYLTSLRTRNCTAGTRLYAVNHANFTNLNSSGDTYGIELSGYYNTFRNLNFTNSSVAGVYLTSATENNFTLGGVSNPSYHGFYLYSSDRNILQNFTFSGCPKGISLENSENNIVSHNIFTTTDTKHFYGYSSTKVNYFNSTFNSTGNFTNQGNQWSDYCEKGKDLNSDGYADNVSSATASDWPYNQTTSSKVYGPGTDWAPQIVADCPEDVVYLSSSSGGGGRVSAAPAAATAPEAKTAVQVTKAVLPVEDYTLDEARKYLKSEAIESKKTSENTFQLQISLKNTGNKSIKLFPQLFQEMDDPFFVVTRKTLGYEDSSLSRIAGISYSEQPIAGRLLKADIVNAKQIVIPPGGKVDQTLEVKEGLAVPRTMKIQFLAYGETVLEQEVRVEKKALTGVAVDQDSANHLLDLYVIIVPAQISEELEKYYAGGAASGLTGAAVSETSSRAEDSQYLLEFSIEKKDNGAAVSTGLSSRFFAGEKAAGWFASRKDAFSELYGPYQIKSDQSLVFGQQFKYDPQVYYGEHLLRAKIYHKGKVVVERELSVDLG